MFAIVAGAPALGVPVTVNATCPPDAMSTSWSIDPAPGGGARPGDGRARPGDLAEDCRDGVLTRAPVTASGPLLVTVTVNTSGWPITKLLPVAVFVTTRSARAATAVEAVAVLLARFGSAVDDATEAALTSVPAAPAVTAIWIEALEPLASEAVVQVTTFPASEQAQPAPAAEPKFTPAGSVSVTTTFCAVSGPLLVASPCT